ncbi:MAG TPA: (2Fe-2S)-binding protein [bacterium]|nr:(2Fe-2S)-binding protein [bacterium]
MTARRKPATRHRARAGRTAAGLSPAGTRATLAPPALRITCSVNGWHQEFTIAPNDLLLDVLRRAGFTGVKEGCREAECGSCTVLVDGVPVTACYYPAARAAGKVITTIEGLERDGQLQRLQESFLDAGAVQCGFCTPGMILAAHALLAHVPQPTDEEIRTALDGNLCRCTGYVKILAAVHAAAGRKA